MRSLASNRTRTWLLARWQITSLALVVAIASVAGSRTAWAQSPIWCPAPAASCDGPQTCLAGPGPSLRFQGGDAWCGQCADDQCGGAWPAQSRQCCCGDGTSSITTPCYGQTPGFRAPMGGWIGPYFRGGPAIPLGEHPFQTNNSAGVNIQLGLRSRLTCGPNDFLFYDLGASFMSVRGFRTVPTGGSIQNTVTGVEIVPSAIYNSQLLNVRRASGDLALGGYFHPLKIFGVPSRFVRGVVRGGGRWGTAFGRFQDQITPEAAAVISSISLLSQTSRINSNYSKTSSFVGLFIAGGIDFILTEPDPNLAKRPFVTFGADVEYSHDWISFKRFSNNPLDAVSIMAHGTLIF